MTKCSPCPPPQIFMEPCEEQKSRSASVAWKDMAEVEVGMGLGKEIMRVGWRGGGQRELLGGGAVSPGASRLRE